jgi:transposase
MARPRSKESTMSRSRSNVSVFIQMAFARRYEGYRRREDTDVAIRKLAADGVPIKQIVKRVGHSRKLVRQVLRGQRGDIFRFRQSSLDTWLPWLDEQWVAGYRTGSELRRRLRAKGFQGSLRVVGEWTTRRRRAEMASDRQLQKVPSARTIARMMTAGRDHLNKAEAVTIAAIEAGVPALAEARRLAEDFNDMIRKQDPSRLDPWTTDAATSLIASFRARPRQ